MAMIEMRRESTLDARETLATRESLQASATILRSLSDATRLTIVQHLLSGEHRVADLVDHLSLAQSTVSAHVACLRDCGLLESRTQGRATHYRLAQPELVTQLLESAGKLLIATGGAATACPSASGAQ
ncbi:ArsR/SmtB family transcription factor [Propioniferax innocua]|uniref:ArsR family transcriptional regulator n=1 Tax=Propioniferax innocua TaxID=1753 RepID=A0A542ZSI8_9ACTN|nr:ArsR family transcriptional regulator [Propioniferax innocua]